MQCFNMQYTDVSSALVIQGIVEIGTGVGYASGPVMGGFLYKVFMLSHVHKNYTLIIRSIANHSSYRVP